MKRENLLVSEITSMKFSTREPQCDTVRCQVLVLLWQPFFQGCEPILNNDLDKRTGQVTTVELL